MRLIGGMEAYEQAGGEVKRDLFDERAQGYALDVALVERLAAEKLETLATDLRAEGWAWAAAYAEPQTKGSAWLPSPIRSAIVKTDAGKGPSEVAGLDDPADEADNSEIDDADMIEDSMVDFSEAAE